jgi:tetratricopeptide (TPR) repeat protein
MLQKIELNKNLKGNNFMSKYIQQAIIFSIVGFLSTAYVPAQSRSRRVTRPAPRSETNKPATNDNAPLLDVQPTRPTRTTNESASTASTDSSTPASSDTTSAADTARPATSNANPAKNASTANTTAHAYALLQQKQYAAAAKEAKQIAASNPNDSEAWKIAGFAEYNLKQYDGAANDLQRALDLQRAANQEDANTLAALAQALAITEKYDRALPLLVLATSRQGTSAPDATLLYYRGVAEYRTNKAQDAERSFSAAIKANPKDAASLYYLGQLAYARQDLDATINYLNRATTSDPRITSAWALLTNAYLRRAAAATTVPARADADYLSAVRAAENLARLRNDAESNAILGQALIAAKQYARAAMVLERATTAKDAKGVTFYLLGVAQSRAKNFPKAITALERAAVLTPDDANVYRELGYAYEVSKLYAKALKAYERGAQLAPNDADFKESIERVRPVAK